jgi:uncharacterized membrane protein YeaQ/YmgE (transglycosylase-associated protein family)
MNFILFLLVGLFAGWLSGQILNGQGYGLLKDILIGIVGAFVGGFIFNVFGITAYGLLGDVVMSVVGAISFLLVVNMITGTLRPTRR